MDINNGKDIWDAAMNINEKDILDAVRNGKKDDSQVRKRIDESRKNIAKVINILEGTVDNVKWACEDAGWDDGVAYQISDAVEKLGYALATLTTWDDDVDQEKTA